METNKADRDVGQRAVEESTLWGWAPMPDKNSGSYKRRPIPYKAEFDDS